LKIKLFEAMNLAILEEKSNTFIDQNRGFEVVDIKLVSTENSFAVMIIYKDKD